MSNKVLFFDLFDTLIKINRGYLEEYFNKDIDKLGDLGILKDSKMTINEILKYNPQLLNERSLEEASLYYDEVMKKSIINVENYILDMLNSLKSLGYKLCIISDAAFVDIKYFNESPLYKIFDDVVFSCEYGVVKPDRKIYEIALTKMGTPEKSIFIGDGGHDELVGAASVGMKTIKVEWFKKHNNYNCVDNVVNMSSYLVKMLEN